jgi:hypothetical protein
MTLAASLIIIGRFLLCLRIPSVEHLLLRRQRPSAAKAQH